jgi:hypothetical protein
MSALRWAAVPLVVGVLTGNGAVAAADEPPPAPAPTPAATPEPPNPEHSPKPSTAEEGVVYTTVTTTTTIVNAPITVVAAPITTTINSGGNGARERFVLNLTGCGRPTAPRVGRAQLRLARDASLVVRVNGRQVTTFRLPATAPRHARGVALRLRLAPSGMLTIRRPSGRVLAVQGCTPA